MYNECEPNITYQWPESWITEIRSVTVSVNRLIQVHCEALDMQVCNLEVFF